MSYGAIAKSKRMRGMILELLQTNHDQQRSRFDSSMLWSALVRGLGFDASLNDVLTVLQDLCDRGYVKYTEIRNVKLGEYRIVQIELTPKGRDLLEGTITDPAVDV
jgi:hypothetical protein